MFVLVNYHPLHYALRLVPIQLIYLVLHNAFLGRIPLRAGYQHVLQKSSTVVASAPSILRTVPSLNQ